MLRREDGSIVLILNGSEEGYRRIAALFDQGVLSRLIGVRVLGVDIGEPEKEADAHRSTSLLSDKWLTAPLSAPDSEIARCMTPALVSMGALAVADGMKVRKTCRGTTKEVLRWVGTDPKRLAEVVSYCHYASTKRQLVVRQEHVAALAAAYTCAAVEINLATKASDKAAIFTVVAKFVVSLGRMYDGAEETAFIVAKLLLHTANFEIENSAHDHIRSTFISIIRAEKITEMVELFDLFWHLDQNAEKPDSA